MPNPAPAAIVFAASMLFARTVSARHQIVCSGEAAGWLRGLSRYLPTAQRRSFLRLRSGCVHVSTPNVQWPKGGRIMAVRSRRCLGQELEQAGSDYGHGPG